MFKTVLILLCLLSNISLNAGEQVLIYKNTEQTDLKLHLLYPDDIKKSDKRAAIIFFFGGGWLSGDINHFRPQAEHFRNRGLICILAEYRVLGKHKTSPFDALSDAKSAMRYLRIHARKLHINPNKIIAAGGSAGGHLAAALAACPGFDTPGENAKISTKPSALLLYNPVLDNGPGGYGYSRVKDRYQEFSPAYNIKPGLPPTLIFLGTKDNIIPVITMEKYREKMIEYNNRCDLFLYEGQDHGFFNLKNGKENPYFYDTLQKADAFLVSLGYLPPQK